jgi:hypothetical protein
MRTELDSLKRSFQQMEQEWDATLDRIAKTLRRIRKSEEALARADVGTVVEGDGSSPLTTITTPPDRMTRIKQQLAARKGGE